MSCNQGICAINDATIKTHRDGEDDDDAMTTITPTKMLTETTTTTTMTTTTTTTTTMVPPRLVLSSHLNWYRNAPAHTASTGQVRGEFVRAYRFVIAS